MAAAISRFPFGQGESGRMAVHARTERAGYRVGAGDRLVNRLSVGDLADDHVDRAVPGRRYHCLVADVGGDGVTFGVLVAARTAGAISLA